MQRPWGRAAQHWGNVEETPVVGAEGMTEKGFGGGTGAGRLGDRDRRRKAGQGFLATKDVDLFFLPPLKERKQLRSAPPTSYCVTLK